MKKFFWLLIIVVVPFELSGQRFNGGLLAGVTASQVDGDSYAGFDKVGLQGGVFVNTMLADNLGLQMEIKYAGRGARKKTSENDPSVYKLKLHYIDIPLLLFYSVKNKYIFEAGLIPGYLFEAGGEDSGGDIPQDYLVKFRKVDFSWLVGFRYRINDNLSAGMRYAYSLVSINDYDYRVPSYNWLGNLFGYNIGDYNNYLTFGIYYQFP